MESAAIVAAAASPAVPISEVVAVVVAVCDVAAAGGRAPWLENFAGGAIPVGLYPPRWDANAIDKPPMFPGA